MSASVAACEQVVAGFVLHACWQVPLLACAAWFAIRVGRPQAGAAHAMWVCTLVLCVALPVCSTVAAGWAARQAQHDAATAGITFEPASYDGTLPRLQREPAWQRLLHRHVNGREGLQPFAFIVPQEASRFIAWSYLTVVAFFALQLLSAWRQAQMLVRRSSCEALPDGLKDVLQQQCARLHLKPPVMRSSGAVAGPVLAGALHPTLLLPAHAMAEMTPAEIEAVLLHELAHLRRRDPLLHTLCSVLLLPVSFHPAAWWTSRKIRQTREMACDAEAAGRMGSHPAYARSLLQVAERIELRTRRFSGLGFFGNGLFGAGLELFNRNQAMEERMQMLMKSRPIEARGRHAARVAACVSLGTTAVLAAGMLQVRPALAGERTQQQVTAPSEPVMPASPQEEGTGARLLSGDHVRQQLRQARQQLDKAEHEATNDEDRRKISTARGIAAAAESAMAGVNSQSGDLKVQVDLSQMQTQLSGLKVPDIDVAVSHLTPQQEAYLQSPEWKAKIEKQRAYFNSPEWKANIERQRAYFDSPEWKANVARQQAYFNSPEWKANIEKQRAYFNSPEWKERTEKQREAALAAAHARMESLEGKQQVEAASRVDAARMEEIARNARQQAERAMEQMRSARIQMADAARLMAHNDGPPPMPVGNTAAEPLKVPSDVMAGNALTRKAPVYPPEAKEKKMQGEVLLHAIISEAGKIEQLSVISSPDKMFSTSAIEAVREWTYKPYLLNGDAKAVDTTITVHYSLTQ